MHNPDSTLRGVNALMDLLSGRVRSPASILEARDMTDLPNVRLRRPCRWHTLRLRLRHKRRDFRHQGVAVGIARRDGKRFTPNVRAAITWPQAKLHLQHRPGQRLHREAKSTKRWLWTRTQRPLAGPLGRDDARGKCFTIQIDFSVPGSHLQVAAAGRAEKVRSTPARPPSTATLLNIVPPAAPPPP